MTTAGSFDWRSLGKADYAQASALVSSLPEEKRACLSGVSHELMCRIIHLSWLFAEKSGRGAAYCWPTLATLGKYMRRSERTVERHLCKLRDAGLISYRRRTTKDGQWTSNLYQAGKTFLASLMARTKKKAQSFRVPTKVSDNDLKREYKAGAPIETGRHAVAVQAKQRAVTEETPPAHKPYVPPAWMSHRVVSSPSLVATGRNDTAWDEEQTDPQAERKALLKQQAAALKARGL